MVIQPDFRELLALFNSRGVEYLIVGGDALAFHGAPRFTGDIDIYVRPDPVNGARIVQETIDKLTPRPPEQQVEVLGFIELPS